MLTLRLAQSMPPFSHEAQEGARRRHGRALTAAAQLLQQAETQHSNGCFVEHRATCCRGKMFLGD